VQRWIVERENQKIERGRRLASVIVRKPSKLTGGKVEKGVAANETYDACKSIGRCNHKSDKTKNYFIVES